MRTASEMERIRLNIKKLMTGYHYITKIYSNAEKFDYKKANNWEKILNEIYNMMWGMEDWYVYSGVANSGQPRLWQHRFRDFFEPPRQYTPLEYLETNGNQYIDTGIVPNTSFHIVIQMAFELSRVGYQMGTEYSSSYPFRFGTNSAGYTMIAFGSANQSSVQAVPLEKYTFDVKNGSQKIYAQDGTEILSKTATMTYYSSSPFILFGLWRGSSYYSGNFGIRIYSCKIYQGNDLVRDFIPVLDSQGNPAMLDLVNEQYYYNALQGQKDFIPSENAQYKKLDWLKNSGTQVIDTGFKHNQNTRIWGNFETTYLQDNSEVYYLGSFGGTQYSDYAFFNLWTSSNNDKHIRTRYANQSHDFSGNISTGIHFYNLNKNVHAIDGTSYTYTARTFQSLSNFCLFGFGGYDLQPTPQEKAYFKLYWTRMWDNGTLIREFIPVRRKSDNQVCMYDYLNDVYYTNSGTGDFIGSDEA